MTLPEAALLAALPRGPSYYSPVSHPERALERRNLVLNSMLEDGVITAQQAAEAKVEPAGLAYRIASQYGRSVVCRRGSQGTGSEIRLGHGASSPDCVSTPPLDLKLQQAANAAVLDGLAAYERRRGWRGNLLNVIAAGSSIDAFRHPDWTISPAPGTYIHGVVTEVLPYEVTVRVGENPERHSRSRGWAWTKKESRHGSLRTGDIVYVQILPRAAEAKRSANIAASQPAPSRDNRRQPALCHTRTG